MNIDLRPGAAFDPDSPVRLYRNLHRGTKDAPVYSVQQRGPKGWLVIGYTDALALMFPTFQVSDAGRERVRRTGKKTVHAYVTGWAIELKHWEWNQGWQAVTYNPYMYRTFVYKAHDTVPVGVHGYAVLNASGVQVAA